ncbi:hypothetical protein [Magnetococcus sp. PR-3]|uniref:hypothetical protein n=1 Tax=Magnetococcus sp. PR-3 TaxID=3120355 RepID=UPI002FCE68D6
MKIKMREGMAGRAFTYKPKEIVDVPADVGKAWCKAGIAEAMETAKVEEARNPALEKALTTTTRRTRKKT